MAVKTNIRSIQFSDELAELIDRQQGRSFTEKFENLITRCVIGAIPEGRAVPRLSTHKEHFDISEGSNSLVQQRHAVTSFTCEIPGKNQPPR